MPVFRTYAGSSDFSHDSNFFNFVAGYLTLLIREIPDATRISLHPKETRADNNFHHSDNSSETYLILIKGVPRGVIEVGYQPYTSHLLNDNVLGRYIDVPGYGMENPDNNLPEALRQKVEDDFGQKEKKEKKTPEVTAKWWIHIRDTCTSEPAIFNGPPEDMDKIEEAYKHFLDVLAKNNAPE